MASIDSHRRDECSSRHCVQLLLGAEVRVESWRHDYLPQRRRGSRCGLIVFEFREHGEDPYQQRLSRATGSRTGASATKWRLFVWRDSS